MRETLDNLRIWHVTLRAQEFKVALEGDTWGQIEEAKESYERYAANVIRGQQTTQFLKKLKN